MKLWLTNIVLPFLVCLLCTNLSVATASPSFEVLLGTAHNFNTPLTIRQKNNDPIRLDAEYETRPLENPVYYNLRFADLLQDNLWEIQFIHHKLHLKNRPEEVESFEITHGFNIFTVNRVWDRFGALWRAGGGIVLAHSESIVRNRERSEGGGLLGTGYRVAGPVLIVGLGKRYPLIEKRLFFNIETQTVVSYVEVKIADGLAEVPHASLHGMLGLGYKF